MHQLALPKKINKLETKEYINNDEEEKADAMRTAYLTSIYWAVSENIKPLRKTQKKVYTNREQNEKCKSSLHQALVCVSL